MADKAKDRDLERKVRDALKRKAGSVDVGKDGLKQIQAKIKSNKGKKVR